MGLHLENEVKTPTVTFNNPVFCSPIAVLTPNGEFLGYASNALNERYDVKIFKKQGLFIAVKYPCLSFFFCGAATQGGSWPPDS